MSVYRDQFLTVPVGLDRHGHFPGCYSCGCAATRCADERMRRAWSHALRCLDCEMSTSGHCGRHS